MQKSTVSSHGLFGVDRDHVVQVRLVVVFAYVAIRHRRQKQPVHDQRELSAISSTWFFHNSAARLVRDGSISYIGAFPQRVFSGFAEMARHELADRVVFSRRIGAGESRP